MWYIIDYLKNNYKEDIYANTLEINYPYST